MKELTFTLLALLFMLTVAATKKKNKGKLSDAERTFAVELLTESENMLIRLLEDLDDETFHAVPEEGRWSVAGHMEHILLSEAAIFSRVKEMAVNSEKDTDLDLSSEDGMVLIAATDRVKKLKTIEPFEPKGKWESRTAMIQSLKDSRNSIREYIRSTDDPLRIVASPTPVGKRDAYQQLLIIAAHGMRHTKHMEVALSKIKLNREYGLKENERSYGVKYLNETADKLIQEISDLSPSQWTYKPSDNVWSIAEISEHILVSEELLFQRVSQMLNSDPSPEKAPEAVGYTQGIVDFMNNREQKFPANSRIQPEAVYKSADDFMHYFNRRRNRTIEFLQTTQEPLSGYHANFRPLGDMNAFQWIVFIGAHTERHLAQIREVKSSPGYSQLEVRN